MGWVIKSIAQVILGILDDLMAWGASLIKNLKLDIGNDGGDILQYIDPATAGQNGVLAKTFPGATEYCVYFFGLAFLLVFIICLFKLWQAYISPFTDAEEPASVLFRTGMAALAVSLSFSIFVAMERIFNHVFKMFKSTFNDQTQDTFTAFKKAKSNNKYVVNATKKEQAKAGTTTKDEGTTFWTSDNLINKKSKNNLTGDGSGNGISLIIIECVVGFALFYAFIKLVMEVYERYLVLGLLFYTCPLAFALLTSKSTKNIVANWFQMLISQFILMCLNLFFVGTFISAFNKLATPVDTKYIFSSDVQFVQTMLLLLGWCIVGQKADEYMRGLGLSVANTGQGLGSALVAGVGSTMKAAQVGYRAGKSAVKTSGKMLGAVGAASTPEAIGAKVAKKNSEMAERAKNAIKANPIGSMSGDSFKNAVKAQGGVSAVNPRVNAANVDYEKSAALSGKGMQVFADSNGNILGASALPGSTAAQKLEDAGFKTMEDSAGNIVPLTESSYRGLGEQLVSMGENGQLKTADGLGIDRTRYDKASIAPNNVVELTSSKTGVSRSINGDAYFGVSNGIQTMGSLNELKGTIIEAPQPQTFGDSIRDYGSDIANSAAGVINTVDNIDPAGVIDAYDNIRNNLDNKI